MSFGRELIMHHIKHVITKLWTCKIHSVKVNCGEKWSFGGTMVFGHAENLQYKKVSTNVILCRLTWGFTFCKCLTLYQTTNFRLVQIESICRLQNKCD